MNVLGQHKVLLLGVCVLFIFRPTLIKWIEEYLCPITPDAMDNCVWVLGGIVVTILFVYVFYFKRLLKEKELFVSRYWTLLILYGGWCIIQYSNKLVFYGIEGWILNYIDYGWIVVGVIELGWFFRRLVVHTNRVSRIEGYPFMADVPTAKDELNRERYAIQLVKKIAVGKQVSEAEVALYPSESSFAILLNEPFCEGKTSFMMQVQKNAEKEGVEVCWFKPWLYDNNQAMIVNFIRVLQEKLGEGDRLLQKMLNRYAHVLSSLKGYELFSFVHKEELSVENQFDEIKAKLREKARPIIVLIDDVDRLQSEELLRMLQMIRNMGDFPYVYYIIAADKVAVQNQLMEAKIADPDEYLKKFFNLEICFPADDRMVEKVLHEGINEILNRYGKESTDVWNFISQLRYRWEIFANIRDIKPILTKLLWTWCASGKMSIMPVDTRGFPGAMSTATVPDKRPPFRRTSARRSFNAFEKSIALNSSLISLRTIRRAQSRHGRQISPSGIDLNRLVILGLVPLRNILNYKIR